MREEISIEGTLLMLDDATPHVSVPVQAICDGEVIATTLSNNGGRYQFMNLMPGRYQLRCQVLGGYVYYEATYRALRFTSYDSVTDDSGHILDVQRGKRVWELKVNGMPLGLMEGAEYQDLNLDLKRGDLVIFYSDGIIEAENEAGEMYQTERLLELMHRADPGLSAQDMVDLIVRDGSFCI